MNYSAMKYSRPVRRNDCSPVAPGRGGACTNELITFRFGTRLGVMKLVLSLLALGALLTGCSSLDTHKESDLGAISRIYIEHRLTDNHRIDEAIVADLKARGYEASCGPLTMLPDGIQAILTYEDRWAWDFNNYLIELRLEMHENFTGKPLATGYYHQASALTKSPPEVVRQILDPLFKRK